MEENNGRIEQNVIPDVEKIIEENNRLKETNASLIDRLNELNNAWMMNRVGFLFEITKNDAFPKEIKERAIKELSEFIYPPMNENKENK